MRVARVEDVPPGQTRYLCVEGSPVVLANVDGQVYALSGTCPHRENPLDGALLWAHLIDCPWHHFQYDVRTGENLFPRNVYPPDIPKLQEQVRPLRTYRVEIRDGDIWMDLK